MTDRKQRIINGIKFTMELLQKPNRADSDLLRRSLERLFKLMLQEMSGLKEAPEATPEMAQEIFKV